MDNYTELMHIPEELKALPQWVCWTDDKIPKNPKTGGNAMSNNPSTWGGFRVAVAATQKYKFHGVGFMFANGYFGVDLDNVVGRDDRKDLLEEFVHTLQSYTEYSKSGMGIHIICKGILPAGGRRRGNVEMYSEGRYFAMTGQIYTDEYRSIKDGTDTIKILHSKYLDSVPQVSAKVAIPVSLGDQELIDKAGNSRSGWLFKALYSGEWEGSYPSQSEADLALLNILAFWTQKNAMQMDRIYRSSGLMRPKWDKRQTGTTWGALQITKACQTCSEVYDPEIHKDDYSIIVKSVGGSGSSKASRVFTKKYAEDDTGNAERFLDSFRQQVKYSYINKNWYFWDGKKWTLDFSGAIKRLADEVIHSMKKEEAAIDDEDEKARYHKHVKYTASSKGKTAMIKESEQYVPVMSEEMDAHKGLLNCQNGVIDLKTGDLLPHNAELLMSQIAHADLPPLLSSSNACAKPEKWLSFLDDITAGDKDLQGFLQRAVGYTLTGSNQEHCMFLCYGGGLNGKSTFLDIIGELCGSYAANVQVETLMVRAGKSGNAPNSDIARLKGIRYVTSAEPTEGMRFNEGLLKQLTGGDRVTARFLYGSDFEFEPEFKLWMAANSKPIIRGTDEGIWRRLKMIPFNVQIPSEKVDKRLRYRLRAELPAIFRWALDGCLQWQNIGLADPECVVAATKEYRHDMDSIAHFLELCVQGHPGGSVSFTDLYKVFTKWTEEFGENKASSNRFGRELSKRYEKRKGMTGYKYDGIELTTYGSSLVEDNYLLKYRK